MLALALGARETLASAGGMLAGGARWSFALFALAGCMTVRETVPEKPEMAHLPGGRETHVQIEGFDATVTTYDMAYGYTTAVHHAQPWYGRRGWGWGGPAISSYSTTEFIPRVQATPVYRDRATDLLECAGCILKSTRPQYRIEVHFEGPYSEGGDGWARLGWTVLTLFTADFGAQTWNARLRVYDLASGRLVFSRDYAQRDEAVVWGPIPFFSPGSSVRTAPDVQKNNCLFWLTDRVVSDCLDFLRK